MNGRKRGNCVQEGAVPSRNGKYPGVVEAEKERLSSPSPDEKPDWICNAPNYDKFPNWSPEEVLVYLNVD